MQIIKPVSKMNEKPAATLAERFEEPKATEAEAPKKRERLFSLDFLRGADIFILTVVSVICYTVDKHFPLPEWFMKQLNHPDWVGFSAFDMIMPLFIFMCGAALPLALPRRLNEDGTAGWKYWSHVFTRVAMLWALGMIAQGELFTFDLHRISFFNNTLQTIAVGYLITAAVALIKSYKVQIAVPFVLAAIYTAFLHLCGDMTPSGNAAVVYEVKFLELFYPVNAAMEWHPVRQIAAWHYTWWTPVPMFGVMGLAGYHATKVLMTEAWSKKRRCAVQALVGVALLALGFALLTFDPCIKHIFTASFTALAMGVSFLLYAGCYWLFDIVEWRVGTSLISLFGRHSLAAYMFVETVFGSILWVFANILLCNKGKPLVDGISRWFGDQATYDIVFTVVRAVVLVLILRLFDRKRKAK